MTGSASLPSEELHSEPPVIMFTAPNPGPKTLDGTHTFVVARSRAFVIDPGPDHELYQRMVAAWVRETGRNVAGILLTHGHPDHAPGAARLKRLLATEAWAPARMPEADARALQVDRRFKGGDVFETDNDTLRVVDTPGHTRDHVGFWLERARILFAGDTILGRGTSLIAPPEGDMVLYMRTLDTLRRLRPRLIAPGHGPLVTDPRAKIDEYIRHREEREAQLLAALEQGPTTVAELVRRVYTDVDPALHPLAHGSVEAQLAKLLEEGRVQSVDEVYSLR